MPFGLLYPERAIESFWVIGPNLLKTYFQIILLIAIDSVNSKLTNFTLIFET